jgi:tetratricopeptide (TPR) repeat protein
MLLRQKRNKPFNSNHMKKIIFLLLVTFSVDSFAQGALTVGNEGGNKRASVSEYIGLAKVTIEYHRPGVKGREGKIWNTPVAHYGLTDLGFGTSTASPWRGGANENTTISFSEDVKIEGRDLAAGIYGFHIILGETDDTLIFSKRSNSWGSFYYDPAEDALRVTVKHQALDKSEEWLKYEFTNQTENSTIVALMWEKKMIPFKIEADIHKIQMAHFRSELKTKPGFTWQAFVQAVNYCLQNNIELEQALAWADEAITARYVGQKNFQTLSAKANVLMALNRNVEAEKLMDEALPLGSMIDLHQYGRLLITLKKPDRALSVFQTNYKNNPNVFTTNVGLGRAFSAAGNYKKAITYFEAALKQAPDDGNKNNVASLIKKIREGKDANL